MTMRIVPNPGQSHADLQSAYGQMGQAPLPQGNPPANLPGSPPFQMPPLGTRYGPGPSYASGQQGVQPVIPPSGLPGPIYPGTWKGHSWHPGPGVKYTGNVDKYMGGQSPTMYGGFADYTQDTEFKKFLKFGIVDNGILIIFTGLGVGLDEKIAKALKVPRGWGPIMGASIGNAVSDGVAALTDKESGMKAALGVTAGCLLPIIPIGIASYMMKKSPQDKTAQYLIMGSSAAMVLWAFMSKK
jgi:hypothetical protein